MQDKNICPKCGKPKEEFAVAWGWEYCYDCSRKERMKKMEKPSFRNIIDPELEKEKEKLWKVMEQINALRIGYEKLNPDWREQIDKRMVINIDKFCRYANTSLEDFFLIL